ncbi:hypothetical protein BH10CYA1_BH10CYA1_49130 [soil metagenome]
MSYTDLLTIASNLLSFDGWFLAVYMFLAGIVAAILQLRSAQGQFFLLWFLGLLAAFCAPWYSDVIIDARFPYVFLFCFGIVGVGLALAGFVAICMSPSIFAFISKIKGRWWMLTANIAMVFPFGPVILFIFVLREYKKSLATMAGDLVQSP